MKHLPIDNPKVVDFGIAIRPNSEVFMGLKPEITMADTDIYNFKLVSDLPYPKITTYQTLLPLRRNGTAIFTENFPSPTSNSTPLQTATTSVWPTKRLKFVAASPTTCPETILATSVAPPTSSVRKMCEVSLKITSITSPISFLSYLSESALKSGIKSGCDFCLPACTELEYFSETTFTPLQDGDDIWIRDAAAAGPTAPWAHKNVSIVHIYFASDSSYARVRKELYGLTDLIGN